MEHLILMDLQIAALIEGSQSPTLLDYILSYKVLKSLGISIQVLTPTRKKQRFFVAHKE